MKPGDFEKKMEGLKAPGTSAISPPVEIKLAIVNAQRSAAMGVWFIVVPAFFIACVFMKYYFHINLGLLDTFEEMMVSLDRNPNTWWIQPVMLIGLPIAGFALNLLAITHFQWDNVTKSITITMKMRWFNLVVLFISACIVAVFLLYLITENFQPRQGH
jgi:hypothetical protein